MTRLLEKRSAEIRYEDLERLVGEGETWREGRYWDFKASILRDASGRKDHRKELLADVSSFANADGGTLVIGVSAKQGVPVALPGVHLAEIDELILQFQALAREHLDPPLTRLQAHTVPGPPGLGFLLVDIPRSLLGPHAVWLDRDGRFWKRNTAGKYQMDVTELREAFLELDRWLDAATATRAARVHKINSGRYENYGFPPGHSVFVLHSIPLGRSRTRFDIDSVAPPWQKHLQPDSSLFYQFRHTLDGGLVYSAGDGRAVMTQCLRDGTVELCVLLGSAYSLPKKPEPINGCLLQGNLGAWLDATFSWQKAAGLEPPIACFVTMLSVNGRNLAARYDWGAVEEGLPFDDRDIELPEVIVQDHTPSDWSHVLEELTTMLWQAAGRPKTPC